MKITVYNEYDPLKTVIIGDASRLFSRILMPILAELFWVPFES